MLNETIAGSVDMDVKDPHVAPRLYQALMFSLYSADVTTTTLIFEM